MTSKDSTAVIILAAGKGTRMKSAMPKVMHKVAGRPLIQWVVETANHLNPEKIIVVVGPDMAVVTDAVAPHQTVIQKQQLGTGDAVKPAMDALKDFEGKVLILLGDEPFLDQTILQEMIDTNAPTVMAVTPPSNKGLGRMVVDTQGNLQKIVEEKDCTSDEKEITLCNAGNYCFDTMQLRGWLTQLGNDNAQGEYYLPDIPAIAGREGVKTKVIAAQTDIGWGINNRIELAAHEAKAQGALRQAVMENGVTMIDPASVFLSWDTMLGQDVLIEPNVYIGPNVQIENGAVIHAFSHIEGASISEEAMIGPFARIRPKSKIGARASVGNFCEINRSELEEKAKCKHVSYVGDAIIGSNTNIGAGTVIANYDGFFKHKSILGDSVFVGSNSTIISPVKIGDEAIIAAGSNITKDISENAMAIGRSRQENHLGWASEYRRFKLEAKKAEEES